MKRILLICIAALGLYSANAQTVDRAIGARFGNGSGFGAEFSYQHPLSHHTRLEGDVYLNYGDHWSGFGVTGLHQWVFNIENGFQWYLGLGASIGTVSYDTYYYKNGPYGYVDTQSETHFTLAFNPNAGIEYCFKNIPLQLAIDARPAINFANRKSYDDFGSIGIAVRYRFN